MTKDMMISRGSGNVFADLGLPDAEEHQLKAQIVTLIARIIEDQHLTQTAAATRWDPLESTCRHASLSIL